MRGRQNVSRQVGIGWMLHMLAGNVHGLFEPYRGRFALRCLAGWEAEEGLTTHSCSRMMIAFSLLPS